MSTNHTHTAKHVIAVGLIASLLATSGCSTTSVSSFVKGLAPGAVARKAVDEQIAAEGAAYTPKTIELVIDTSGSTLRDREMYVRIVKAVLEHLQWGDRLLVSEVAADSVANSAFLLELELPAFEPDLPAEPASDNEFDIATWKTARAEAYGAQWEKFQAKNDLEAARNAELARAKALLLKRKTGASDLVGAAEVAALVTRRSTGPTAVIFLSDGLIKTDDINFYEDRLTAKRVSRILERLDRTGALPDFSGTPAYWIGLRATDANPVAAVRDFWLGYAKRANLSLEKGDAVGRPSLILFDQWLDTLDADAPSPEVRAAAIAGR